MHGKPTHILHGTQTTHEITDNTNTAHGRANSQNTERLHKYKTLERKRTAADGQRTDNTRTCGAAPTHKSMAYIQQTIHASNSKQNIQHTSEQQTENIGTKGNTRTDSKQPPH